MFSNHEPRVAPRPLINEHPDCQPIQLWTVGKMNTTTFTWEGFLGSKKVAFRQRYRARPQTLDAVINDSRWILALEDNFDGEHSEHYTAETWGRAVEFLRGYLQWTWENYGVRIPAPRIRPGPEGSVDIRWKTDTYELLLNFPRDPKEMATYYGEDDSRQVAEGQFKQTVANVGLVTWFIEHTQGV